MLYDGCQDEGEREHDTELQVQQRGAFDADDEGFAVGGLKD